MYEIKVESDQPSSFSAAFVMLSTMLSSNVQRQLIANNNIYLLSLGLVKIK